MKEGKTSKSYRRWVSCSKQSSVFLAEQCMKIRQSCFSIWQKMFKVTREFSISFALTCSSFVCFVEQDEETVGCCREFSIRYQYSAYIVMLSYFEARAKSCKKCGNSILPEGDDRHSSVTFKSTQDCEIGDKMLLLWKNFLILMLLRVFVLATSPCLHRPQKIDFISCISIPFQTCSIRSRTVPKSSFLSFFALKKEVHRWCWCLAVFGATFSALFYKESFCLYTLLCNLLSSVCSRCVQLLLKKDTITADSFKVVSTIFLSPTDSYICCMISNTFSAWPRSPVSILRQQTSAMQMSNRLKSSTSYLVDFYPFVLNKQKKMRYVMALYTNLGLISNSLRKTCACSKVCSGFFWCMAVFSIYFLYAFRKGRLSSNSKEFCQTFKVSIATTSAPKSLLCKISSQSRSKWFRTYASKASFLFFCGKVNSSLQRMYVRGWASILGTVLERWLWCVSF